VRSWKQRIFNQKPSNWFLGLLLVKKASSLALMIFVLLFCRMLQQIEQESSLSKRFNGTLDGLRQSQNALPRFCKRIRCYCKFDLSCYLSTFRTNHPYVCVQWLREWASALQWKLHYNKISGQISTRTIVQQGSNYWYVVSISRAGDSLQILVIALCSNRNTC
jgi:hypothetical protein